MAKRKAGTYTYSVARSNEEIDKAMNDAAEQTDKGGSKWPGQSYEEGVKAALGWIIGDYEDNPMEDA